MGGCGSDEQNYSTPTNSISRRPKDSYKSYDREIAPKKYTTERNRPQGIKETIPEMKKPSFTDTKSINSGTTSASSSIVKVPTVKNASKSSEEELNEIRRKEKWAYEYLANASSTTEINYLIDADWVDKWIRFLHRKDLRPWLDLNKKLYTLKEDGRILFRSSKKTYIVNEMLWNTLRKSYGSSFIFEIEAKESYKCYKLNPTTKTEEEVEIISEEDDNKSESEYMPTERDPAYPKKHAPEPENLLQRLHTVQFVKGKNSDKSSKRIRQKLEKDVYTIDMAKEKLRVTQLLEYNRAETLFTCDGTITAPAIGLKNYGVTCYVNAGLQCLLCIPEMNAYFLEEQYKRLPYETKTSKFRICEALHAVYQEIFSDSSPDYIAPREIVKLCSSGQQDAHEFLWKKLFLNIQNETNPAVLLHRQETLNSEKAWQLYTSNNKCIFDRIFGGQYESKVRCTICNYESLTFDPFLDVSLSASKRTVYECLAHHFQSETLTKADSYKCEKCRKPVVAVKTLSIDRSPRYLIIHFKRLVGRSRKINSFIQYPMVLDISEFSVGKEELLYDLVAVCVHNGGGQSGHYYAIGLRNLEWYHFDDTSVRRISESEVLKQEAYMLFYRKSS